MWQWTLNWDEVREDLVIGSCPMAADDIDAIRVQTAATALLSVQTDECRTHFGIDYAAHRDHGARSGLTMVNSPMLDFNTDDQRRRLPDAVHCLHVLLASGHRVYVHCTAGINRSPLTVLGYLAFVEGRAPDEAITMIVAGRRLAEPDWEAYRGARADLVERHRGAVLERAFDLYRMHPGADAEADWLEAERAVIREAFERQLPASRRRAI